MKDINIKDLISNLNKATVLEVKRDKNSFIAVSIHIPTTDLDDIYSVYSNGGGFILHWEGMEMVTEDICLLKEDFSLLYIEVLKELMKREEISMKNMKFKVETNKLGESNLDESDRDSLTKIESAMFSSVARGEMPCDIYKAMIGAVK